MDGMASGHWRSSSARPARPRNAAASPQQASQCSCCQPENPGVRKATPSITEFGTAGGLEYPPTPAASVNSASNFSWAEPSGMHQGQKHSDNSSTENTGPMYM